MDSRRVNNYFPDLDSNDQEINTQLDGQQMESEDLEFYKEMEKAKALSMITARLENDQRKSVCSNNVPALKPPPRNQRQQFIPESNYDSGVARPKPCVRDF